MATQTDAVTGLSTRLGFVVQATDNLVKVFEGVNVVAAAQDAGVPYNVIDAIRGVYHAVLQAQSNANVASKLVGAYLSELLHEDANR